MINGPNYARATNTAYIILDKFKVTSTPIDIFIILNNYSNILIVTYSEWSAKYNMTFNEFIDMGVSDHGFTFREKNLSIIVYNETKDMATIRFTLAHELGHIFLNHTEDNDVSNKEANCYARNTLCPIAIADELELLTPCDYSNCFNVSDPMASVSFLFRSADRYNISAELYKSIRYSCHQHVLEHKQFLEALFA